MAYQDIMRRRVRLAGRRLTLLSKPGVVQWDEVAVATELLAEDAEFEAGARVLVLEGGAGALAVWAAGQGAVVEYGDGSLTAYRMAGETLAANDVSTVTRHEWPTPPPALDGVFDGVLLVIPKGRAYTQWLLDAAHRALRAGGRLYLAGPNAGGAKAIVKDAGELFGRAATLRTKARHRVALAVKGAETPDPPPVEPASFTVADLTLYGLPGVFSRDRLDDGTAMLLSTLNAQACAGKRILDMGCGTGVIGLTAARLGAAQVDLVDAAWAAVACAQRGIAANGLADSCRAWASDLFADMGDDSYDLILSNPPFHAGHGVDTAIAEALIAGARARLASGGRLRLVANHFLPYTDALRRAFNPERVTILTEDTRYYVVEARA